MRPEAKKLLFDMLAACRQIRDFTAGKSLEDYRADALLRSALERQFQVLGEALSQLSRRCPDMMSRIPDHRGIINFRNVLVHGYDVVEDDVVWGLAESRVDPLKTLLEKLLSDPDGQSGPTGAPPPV